MLGWRTVGFRLVLACWMLAARVLAVHFALQWFVAAQWAVQVLAALGLVALLAVLLAIFALRAALWLLRAMFARGAADTMVGTLAAEGVMDLLRGRARRGAADTTDLRDEAIFGHPMTPPLAKWLPCSQTFVLHLVAQRDNPAVVELPRPANAFQERVWIVDALALIAGREPQEAGCARSRS